MATMQRRLLQVAVVLLSVGLLVALACRAQEAQEPRPMPATKAGPVLEGGAPKNGATRGEGDGERVKPPDAGVPDAAPSPAYFPASKSGAVLPRQPQPGGGK